MVMRFRRLNGWLRDREDEMAEDGQDTVYLLYLGKC